MKRILVGLSALLFAAGLAYAVQTTPTAPIAPNETGENSLSQQEIFNVSRLKPSFGTVTSSGSGTAQTATLNKTAGVITTAAWTVVSGAGASATLTLTNNHIQAGDIVIGQMDDTGATAASLLEVSAVQVSANQAIFKIVNNFTTANTQAAKVMFMVISQGNGN